MGRRRFEVNEVMWKERTGTLYWLVLYSRLEVGRRGNGLLSSSEKWFTFECTRVGLITSSSQKKGI